MPAALVFPSDLSRSHVVTPSRCDERGMQEVLRFVEGLDVHGLRELRDVAVELLQGLVRKLH